MFSNPPHQVRLHISVEEGVYQPVFGGLPAQKKAAPLSQDRLAIDLVYGGIMGSLA